MKASLFQNNGRRTMTNGNDPNKTPPPPPPPTGLPKPGELKPDTTTVQPPQIRLAIVSGIGGFIGALIGALLACHFCMQHRY
jgi:hypothetical protein